MHIYEHYKEPVIGNERLALAELISRKISNVHAGPNVWEPMNEHYPKVFAHDRRHPNEIGAEVMAQHWFETLLRHDGRDVPSGAGRNSPRRSSPRQLRRMVGSPKHTTSKSTATEHENCGTEPSRGEAV